MDFPQKPLENMSSEERREWDRQMMIECELDNMTNEFGNYFDGNSNSLAILIRMTSHIFGPATYPSTQRQFEENVSYQQTSGRRALFNENCAQGTTNVMPKNFKRQRLDNSLLNSNQITATGTATTITTRNQCLDEDDKNLTQNFEEEAVSAAIKECGLTLQKNI